MKYFSATATALVLLLATQGTLRAEISINPYPLGQGNKSRKTSSEPMNIRPDTSPARNPFAGAPPSSMQWQAFKGASAHEVLDSWSQDAGVEIIWNSDEDYSIPATVKLAGSYESAVEALLNQYGNEYGRPVGNLYVDPSSGKKTLVVTTFEGN